MADIAKLPLVHHTNKDCRFFDFYVTHPNHVIRTKLTPEGPLFFLIGLRKALNIDVPVNQMVADIAAAGPNVFRTPRKGREVSFAVNLAGLHYVFGLVEGYLGKQAMGDVKAEFRKRGIALGEGA